MVAGRLDLLWGSLYGMTALKGLSINNFHSKNPEMLLIAVLKSFVMFLAKKIHLFIMFVLPCVPLGTTGNMRCWRWVLVIISLLLPNAVDNIVPFFLLFRSSVPSYVIAAALILHRQAGQKAISIGCSTTNRGSLCR